jgi:carboxymethylenebutenolidase
MQRTEKGSRRSPAFLSLFLWCQNIDRMTLDKIWEEHTRDEFVTRDVESTLATMVEDAYVNHIPVMTVGVGKEELRRFYSEDFIPRMPADTKLTPISRTIGTDQLVDEMIFSFTHTEEMPWMLPGIKPTNKAVQIPLVAIVHFRDGKLAHEHIYWDQGSVLKQIGLLSDPALPVVGAEAAAKVSRAYERSGLALSSGDASSSRVPGVVSRVRHSSKHC